MSVQDEKSGALRFIPTVRTIVLAAALIVPLLFFGMGVEYALPALAGDMFILAAYLLETKRLRQNGLEAAPLPTPHRRVGDEVELSYTLTNRGARALKAVVRQPMPEGWEAIRDRVELTVPPKSAVDVSFTARPPRRGLHVFPDPELTYRAERGWFAIRVRRGPGAEVLVHPALGALVEVERMRRGRGMVLHGLRRRRTVGTGSEFERLRAYLPDDDFRHINWKNTARMGKPVTNVYQSEKGRDVLICVDCGRMMGQAAGSMRVIDAAVEAGIVLTRSVVKEGDRPGMVAFRDKVENYLPVKGGKVGAMRVTDALAGLEASPVHTSYSALAEAVSARQNRRSLVVVFTDFNDPQLAEDLAAAMRLLRVRHAAVVIGVRDRVLDEVAAAPYADRKGLCRALAAARLAEERDAAALDLRKLGVEVVESDGPGMAVAAVERYLSVKAGRMLD